LRTNETRARIEEARRNFEQRREEVHFAETSLKETENRVRQLDSDLTSLQRAAAERESKLDVLQTLLSEGEGLNEGAQAVLRGLDNPDFFKPAVLGSLAALIEVADENFIPAVEAALGQNMQAVVVKDAAVAEAAIQTLHHQKIGRATITARGLLPRQSATQIEALPEGALAWAIDKVKAPEEIAPLICELLKEVLIVPDLETALRLRDSAPHVCFANLCGETL